MQNILNAINRFIGLVDNLIREHQTNKVRDYLLKLRELLTFYEACLKDGSFKAIISKLMQQVSVSDLSKETGIVRDLAKLWMQVSGELYESCSHLDLNSSEENDEVLRVLNSTIAGFNPFLEAIDKQSSWFSSFDKKKALSVFRGYQTFLRGIAIMRRHNLREANYIIFVNEIKKNPASDKIETLCSNFLNNKTNLFYFNFVGKPADEDKQCIRISNYLNHVKNYLKAEFVAQHSDKFKQIDKNILLIQSREDYRKQWTEVMLDQLECLADNLDAGIQAHCKPFFKSTENETVKAAMIQLNNYVLNIYKISIALIDKFTEHEIVDFESKKTPYYSLFCHLYLVEEITNLRLKLEGNYNLALSTNHPIQRIFELTFAKNYKSDSSKTIHETVFEQIRKVFKDPYLPAPDSTEVPIIESSMNSMD